MTSSGEGEDKRFPFAWLWNNKQLADVSFSITFNPAPPPSETPPFMPTLQAADDASPSDPTSLPAPASEAITDISNATSLPATSSTEHTDTSHVEPAVKTGQKINASGDENSSKAGKSCTYHSFVKAYLLHSQLLSSTSAFFRASLTTEVGEPSHKKAHTESACTWQLQAGMCAEDGEAVEAVLFSLYKPQEYDDTQDSELLLRIMKVADLWQVEETAAAASKALCSRTELFPLSLVYTLPEGLTTSVTFSQLMVAAERVLLLTFGDARAVIDSPCLLQQFMELPYAALHVLLHSPELATDVEASVLLLFSGWCEGAVGRACFEQQLQQLNCGIRYSRLSTPYLTDLSQRLQSPKLTQGQLAELWHFGSIPEHLEPQTNCELDNPKGWYLPKRPLSLAHEVTTLDLVVTKLDLKLLLAAAAVSTSIVVSKRSKEVYASGHLWALDFTTKRGELGLYVYPQGLSLGQATHQAMPFKHGVVCEVSMWIKKPEVVLLDSEEALLGQWGYGVCLTKLDTQEGLFPDCALLDWWEPYTVDGCVHLAAEITDIAA